MWGFFTGGAGFLPVIGAVIVKEQLDIFADHEKNLAAQWYYEKNGYKTKVYKMSYSHIEDYNVPKELKDQFNKNYIKIFKDYTIYKDKLRKANKIKYPAWQYGLAFVLVGIIYLITIL